jgi:hypothetical protein
MRPDVPPPRMTPTRDGASRERSRPDAAIASAAATIPMRSARDMRRRSAWVREPSGMVSTCAAVCVLYDAESNSENGRIPQTPASRLFQNSGSEGPMEVTAPSPVIRTRREGTGGFSHRGERDGGRVQLPLDSSVIICAPWPSRASTGTRTS